MELRSQMTMEWSSEPLTTRLARASVTRNAANRQCLLFSCPAVHTMWASHHIDLGIDLCWRVG